MEKTEYIDINGTGHFFIEYETDFEKPVILYVHGGPGLAESLVGWEIAGYTEKFYNWIFYDQRGAGRTYYKSPDGLVTYEDIYSDLDAIVRMLHERYGKKIFIMAHNWGTIPAIRYVRENPRFIAGYIGNSQIVDMVNIAKTRCARVKELALSAGSKRDAKTIDKLSEATGGTFARESLTKKQITKLNVLLGKYNIASGTDKLLMKKIPTNPLYDMVDLRILMSGPKISYKLNEYMRGVNLFDEDKAYEVPMMFITGNWDYQYPYKTAADYMEQLSAPCKQMTVIEDATYDAMYEKPEEFWEAFTGFVDNV